MWYSAKILDTSGMGLGRFGVNTLKKLGRVILWPQIIHEHIPDVFGDHCKHMFPFYGSKALILSAGMLDGIYLLMLFRSTTPSTFNP